MARWWDILLTNYVMLELILTRLEERELVNSARELRVLVLDEMHTYRGRQGADVSMLVRQCREAFGGGDKMLCVGTSATMASEGDSNAQAAAVAEVAETVFGQPVRREDVVAETLVRATKEIAAGPEEVAAAVRGMAERVANPSLIPQSYEALRDDPLASWIERTFGLRREAGTQKLVRQIPLALRGPGGGGEVLAKLTRTSVEASEVALERCLPSGAQCRNADSPYPLFAFRLHQFIARGDTVWATLEPEQTPRGHCSTFATTAPAIS